MKKKKKVIKKEKDKRKRLKEVNWKKMLEKIKKQVYKIKIRILISK